MGHGCSCRGNGDKVVDTFQYDPTFASVTFASASMEAATKELGQFFDRERHLIPMKLLFYYVKVLEGSARYEHAIIVKFVRLGDSGCTYLVRLLPFYVHIKELHLWKAGLSPSGFVQIIDSFSLFTKLKVLNLTDNHLKDECLLALTRAFPLLSKLEDLWLSANDLTSSGIKLFASCLSVLPQLKSLGLSYNYIATDGCRSLCGAIQNSRNVRSVELAGNQLGSECVEMLTQLAMAAPLLRLDLRNNEFSAEECEVLLQAFGPDVVMVDGQKKPRS